MSTPRVLYLSSWPIGAHGEGEASFVYDQIDALSNDVRAVYVEHRFDNAFSWARRRALGLDVEEIEDLWPERVIALRVWTPRWSSRITRRGVLDDVWRAGPMVAARAARALGGIDLVHAHVVLPAGLLGAAIAKALGVPLVVQEHSGPFDMHLDTDEKRGAACRAIALANSVVAVGDDLARRIGEAAEFQATVSVVPNLVRTDLFEARAQAGQSDRLRIVTVGSLHPVKGLDILIRAVADLRARNYSIRAEIAGDGPIRSVLESLILELNVSNAVTLAGPLTRAAVAERLAGSHVYVCSSRHETFGLAPAEALAVGRPVVSTRCGGPESFVSDAWGVLIPPDDPRAMADAILATWRRRADFEPLAMHDYVAARFGPDVFRGRMRQLYNDVLGDRASA